MHPPNHRPRRYRDESDLDESISSAENHFSTSSLGLSSTTSNAWSPAIVEELLLEGKCPPGLDEFYCFRGRCFTIRTRSVNGAIPLGVSCECDRGWIGYRCQVMDAPHISQVGPDKTPTLIARTLGLSFAGLILLAILVVLGFAYYRRKKQLTVSPFEAGSVSQAFHNLKKQCAFKRTKRASMCNLLSSDDLLSNRAVKKGTLHTVCQQKHSVPLWRHRTSSSATTVAAAPWSQVREGSPVPSTVPHSPLVVHWTPSGRTSKIPYESIYFDESIV